MVKAYLHSEKRISSIKTDHSARLISVIRQKALIIKLLRNIIELNWSSRNLHVLKTIIRGTNSPTDFESPTLALIFYGDDELEDVRARAL